MARGLAIDALLMAVWRRKPKQEVMIHSGQGSQFSSGDWQSFLKANNVLASISRGGNCHDSSVAQSFFQLLKREPMCSITSRCSATQNAGMALTTSCRQ
jgi:putative transposase